ncbi:DUF6309 family protein [Streptomyces sp. NPDC057638]|uniref:DUF6309 family protein n=1 Tax=Streptomyces sp. NPDC057638 TaxID=3346190 RepID=UPI0036C21DCF
MRVLQTVGFEAVLSRFQREHPYDASDETNFNDDAEVNLHRAQEELGGRWHRVLLEGPEIWPVVLPWHLGEDGEVELIPKTGLTVAEATERLTALGTGYARANPMCAVKLDRQTGAERLALYLSTRPISGPDYADMTARGGLIHMDGLHRMLAWAQAGLLSPGTWIEAYVAGLDPAQVAGRA